MKLPRYNRQQTKVIELGNKNTNNNAISIYSGLMVIYVHSLKSMLSYYLLDNHNNFIFKVQFHSQNRFQYI